MLEMSLKFSVIVVAATVIAAGTASAQAIFGSRASIVVDASPLELAVVDLDGDGALDIVTANESGGDGASLSILRGYGNGSFHPEERINLNPSRYIVHAVVGGDFDADGLGDLGVAVDDITQIPTRANVLVYLSESGGQFGRPVAVPMAGMFPRLLSRADLDGDGIDDLVACVADVDTGTGLLVILIGDGEGGFTAKPPVAIGPAPQFLTVADVDGDDALDILVGDAEEPILHVLYGNVVDGTFTAPEEIAIGAVATSAVIVPERIGAFAELIATSIESSELLRFRQFPPRTFALETVDVVDDPPTAAVGVDTDADGNVELVTLSAINNRLVVFALEADRSTRLQRLTVDLEAGGLRVADLNGDARPDVAMVASGADVVNVFLGGTSPASTPEPTLPGSEPTPTPDTTATATPVCPGAPGCETPDGTPTPGTEATITATATAMIATATPTATATPEVVLLDEGEPGDANCDGFIDEDDLAALMLQMFWMTCTGADVDGDGVVSAADIVELIRWMAAEVAP